MLSLASLLLESAQRSPDRVAVSLGASSLTYRELGERSLRVAALLRTRGVVEGTKVALLLPNVLEFPIAYYGILAAGAVVVPVHALLKAGEIRYVLENSGAQTLISGGPLLAEGERGARDAGIPVCDLSSGAPATAPLPNLITRAPDDTAVILYTSGTTGKAKGAELTHLNLTLNAMISATQVIGLRSTDSVLGCLPLFHSFGQTCAMNAAFYAGARLVLMPRFGGPEALELLVREKIDVFEGVPTMYHALLEAARASRQRPVLRMAVSGGASLPLKTIDEFKEAFGADIYEGYGLSETSPVATFNQSVFGRKAGSVGCAIWGTEVAIADPALEERIAFLPTGELGEVVLRGHNIMKGYLGNPEATKAAIVDGWFRTGDLGTKDAEGFVRIVDRKKDMINRGGFKVFPREVEEELLHHPAVAQAAVIGLPDSVLGEEVCAVIVLKPGTTASDSLRGEISTWVSERLAAYKYPRRVEFADSLPLGPSGKVLKRELVKRYGSA
jgi:long-chain acyl-CoA synthetase